DQFLPGRKARFARHGGEIHWRRNSAWNNIGGNEVTQIGEGITHSGHLPVENRENTGWRVLREHQIADAVVPVDDRSAVARGEVFGQPAANEFDIRKGAALV